MIFLAQTNPEWEYWGTSTYLAIAIAFIVIATLTALLVHRYWRKAKAQDYGHTH